MLTEILLLLSSSVLGIFLGAQITEAFLFVPYWKTIKPDDFFKFYQTYGKKIHQFFAPLTIVSTLLPLITVSYGLLNQIGNQILLLIVGLSTLAFFSTYFLYFKNANEKFTTRSLSNENLSHELMRWEIWHWGRILFECIAFGTSLLLLRS
jgi:hypothetical protein